MVHFGFARHLPENPHTCYLLQLAVGVFGKTFKHAALGFVHKTLYSVGGLALWSMFSGHNVLGACGGERKFHNFQHHKLYLF